MGEIYQESYPTELKNNIFNPTYNFFWRYIGWLSFIFLLLLFINDFLLLELKILYILISYVLVACIFTFFWKHYPHNPADMFSIIPKIDSTVRHNQKLTKFFYVSTEIVFTFISTFMSLFLFFELLATSYESSFLWAWVIIIVGLISFFFLPLHSAALLAFIHAIHNMNFYGENFEALLNNMGSTEVIDFYKICVVALFSLIYYLRRRRYIEMSSFESIKVICIPLLFFSVPYFFALLIDFLCDFPKFAQIYFYDFSSIYVSIVSSILYGLAVFGLMFLHKKNNRFLFTYTLIGILITIIFFFPLKAQASTYQEHLFLLHQEFYEEAMNDDGTVPGQRIILMEKAAEAGNPKAMYEVAHYYFTSDAFINMNLQGVEKYVKYLYLSMIFGNDDARYFLISLAKGDIYPKGFIIAYLERLNNQNEIFGGEATKNTVKFVMNIVNQIQPQMITYSVYNARYYLSLDAVFHNGYFLGKLKDQRAIEDQKFNISRGKEILEELATQGLSSKPTVTLAEIDFLENNIDLGLSKLHKYVEQDDTEALFTLGLHYYYDRQFGQNMDLAMEFFDRARKKNHTDSRYIWSITILNDPNSSNENKDLARVQLMQLYSDNHPGAKLYVALRWFRNDAAMIETEITGPPPPNSMETILIEQEVVARGKQILENIISGGENVKFNNSGSTYMPLIMGKEVVIATYELALSLYNSNNKLESALLLARDTQLGHKNSAILLSKIVAEDKSIYPKLPL